MSRVKLSEFRAKQLLFDKLGRKYRGLAIDLQDKNYPKNLARLPAKGLFVAKVDQALKKRGKAGLVKVGRNKNQLSVDLRSFAKQGFRYALVEPFIKHEASDEQYLALARDAGGVWLSYSPRGGVEIESQATSLKRALLSGSGYDPEQNNTGADDELVRPLYELFQKSHMTLLEINPFIVDQKGFMPLDAAVEVDSAGQFFVDGAWSDNDVRKPVSHETELTIERLNAKSPASLSLKVLNPDGSLFLLLSGGGASVVVADELSQLGQHTKIANYGEYSGNPSADETYIYTREILRLLLASKARKKVLIIAGGVANFTDVAKTFAGVIRALRESTEQLRQQKIRVVVRRGGPNQVQGLAAMRSFLAEIGLNSAVYGPEKSLSRVVNEVVRAAK